MNARIVFDVSMLDERIQMLKEKGATQEDIDSLRRDAPTLIKIQSYQDQC